MLSRRSLLLACPPALAACARGADATPSRASASASAPSAAPAPPPAPSASAELPADLVATRLLPFGGRQAAVVVAPTWTGADRLPLLVALHGLGESKKGVEGGAWGWPRDYALTLAMARLRQPPLTAADFQGIYDARRIERINASLAERPFRGLLVACPFTPDLLREKTLDNAGPFASFVVRELLPAVRGAFPAALGTRAATGIDGVSLGGRVALLVGLLHPDTFGAIGSLQAALQVTEARPLARRVLTAREKAGDFRLRLLTSEKDFYRGEILAFHRELERLQQVHEHVVVPGPHDYPFNRGPGAIEMLLWHDRVLRGEPG
ncbi:MAG: alpha/beta hydrolase-fold protein [Polyangiaceae bacterium]|nr:alpha/beta hydrolase-fold protein [Polyangiaceae bacterium]